MSENSSLYFSSPTPTTGSLYCNKRRTPLPLLSRSTKICLRRKTRTNSLITCRTSDFSVKGFCVMMETEELHPELEPWRPFSYRLLGAMRHCNLCVQIVMYSMSVCMCKISESSHAKQTAVRPRSSSCRGLSVSAQLFL